MRYTTGRIATPILAAATLSGFALMGCGPSEADARAQLEKEDKLTDIELKKEGSTFTFSGTKGDQRCEGVLTLVSGWGSSSYTKTSSCQLDTRACKAGAAAACNKLADKLYDADSKVFPETAAELYRTACADDDAHACERAGEFEAIDKRWDKVREYSKKACDLGAAEACTRYAFTEEHGDGTAKNAVTALAMFRTACDKGSLKGCRAAAGLLMDAEPSDPAAAVPLAEKACKGRHADGCLVLGVALFHAKKDYPTALAHLVAGCDDDKAKLSSMACNLAGVILWDGLDVPHDKGKALTLFERACADDSLDGCINAGKAYQAGQGVARDATKAAELFARACQLGSQKHCAP